LTRQQSHLKGVKFINPNEKSLNAFKINGVSMAFYKKYT